jgi:hypothetical protein
MLLTPSKGQLRQRGLQQEEVKYPSLGNEGCQVRAAMDVLMQFVWMSFHPPFIESMFFYFYSIKELSCKMQAVFMW